MLKGIKRVERRLRGGLAQIARPAAGGIDAEAFLALARESFVRLQAAWDVGDELVLASIATQPLMEDLRCQLLQRGPGENRTEVVRIEASLLGLDELLEAYVASVEFSGLIRERRDAVASPFRELWLLASLKQPAPGWQGWRLAGVQALT